MPDDRDRPSFGRAAAQIGTLLLLAVLVPLYVFLHTPDVPAEPAWPLAALLAVYGGARLSFVLTGRSLDLFKFSFWLFVYEFLGLAPIAQLRFGTDPDTTPGVVHSLDYRTFGIIYLGVAAAEVGFAVAHLRPLPLRVACADDERRVVKTAAAGIFFAGSFIVLIGPHAYEGSRQGLTVALAAHFSDPAISSIANALSVAPLLVATLTLLRMRRGKALDQPHTLLIGFCVLLLLFIANPLANARYVTGTIYLSLFVAAFPPTRPRLLRALLLAVTLVAVFGFSYLAVKRFDQPTATARNSSVTNLATSGDYDSFAEISNTVLYVQELGIVKGHQALGELTFFVPRSIWASKPTDTGILLANFRGYKFTNLSAPLWSESYINFGYPGVVLVFGVGGYVASRRLRQSSSAAALVFSFYTVIILRGSLLQATGFVVVVAIANRLMSAPAQSGSQVLNGRFVSTFVLPT